MNKTQTALSQQKAKIPETSRGPLARQVSFLEERLATLGSKETGDQHGIPELGIPLLRPDRQTLEAKKGKRDVTIKVHREHEAAPSAPLPQLLTQAMLAQKQRQKKQRVADLQAQLEAPATVSPTSTVTNTNYLPPLSRATTAVAAPIQSAKTWIPLGPTAVLRGQGGAHPTTGIRPTMSGRVEGIAIAPGGKRIYAATANGGVWRSEDAGKNWNSLMDNFDLNPTATGTDTLACGAIALVPGASADKDRIYVGSGGSTLNGVGPLVSVNGGASWQVEASDPPLIGERFFALAVDPTNPQHVIAATSVGLYERRPQPNAQGGTYYWQAALDYVGGYGCYGKDVAIVRANNVTTYYALVMFYVNDWQAAVYISPDGHTWQLFSNGLPVDLTDGNGCLAVIANNADNLYALLGMRDQNLPVLYRCEVKNKTWRKVNVAFPNGAQFKWYLEMAVDPNNINRLYLAGNTVFVEEEGYCGEAYRCEVTDKASTLTATATYLGVSIHADAHCIAFAPGDSNKLWIGTDGGLFYTTNPTGQGYIFNPCNTGLASLTMNHLGQHPTEDAILYCGTQDNGGLLYTGDGAWTYVSGGDSGYFVVNWYNPSRVLDTYTYSAVRSSEQGGQSDSFDSYITIPIATGENCLFYAPLAGTPYRPDLIKTNPRAAEQEANLVAFGSERPWLSTDFGNTWFSIPTGTLTGDVLNGRIKSITLASATKLYVGTMKGGVYRFDKVGPQWQRTRIDNKGGLPENFALPVTDLAVDPKEASGNAIYITFGGSGDFRHVWYFNGNQWTQRSGNPSAGNANVNLLDVQHNALVIDPLNPNHLYVGADIGVWRSTDAGNTWAPFSKGLPDAAVMDLRIHNVYRLLRASTFGRGVFELPLDDTQQQEVTLYLRSTVLDRGLYPCKDGLPDPCHPGQVVDHRDSPDIKLSLAENGTFPLPTTINFEEFSNLLSDQATANETTDNDQVRVYVKVYNRGTKSASGVGVMLIGAAVTGDTLPPLPAGFAGDVQDNDQIANPNWRTFGTQSVNEVRAGFPKVVCFTVEAKMIARGAQPYGLLALAYHAQDPFNATETNPHQLCFNERKAAMKYVHLTVIDKGLNSNVLLLNGETDHINLGNRPALQITGNQTLEMWIKPHHFERRQNPFGKAYGGEGTITLETNGTLTYYYGTRGDNNTPCQEINSQQPLTAKAWSHLAIVRNFDKKKLTWYINGNLVNEEPTNFTAALASNLPALLGKGYKSNFGGGLAEVRIWNKARSQPELQASMNQWLMGDEPGLVAYYRLDEGQGTTVTDIVSGATATVSGGQWTTAVLPVQRAAISLVKAEVVSVKFPWFDGNTSIDLGNRPALQIAGSQTIEMWIRPTNLEARRNPVAKAYGGEGTIALEKDGSLTYYYGNAGGNGNPYQGFSSVKRIDLNAWSHIAIVRNLEAKKLTWYLNGEKVNEDKALYLPAKASNLPALLGKGYLANFIGQLAEVRFWNKARSPVELTADMKRMLTGKEPGLAAYYRLNEGNGTQVTDLVSKTSVTILGNRQWQASNLLLQE